MKKYLCHDCKKEAEFDGDEITNGVIANYDVDGEKIQVFKCNDCFSKNKGLNNYQNCEVYSRIVGYIRPVQQFNLGKKQEFEERKEYKNNQS